MDDNTPLADTRYVFTISKYIILMKKKAIQNAFFRIFHILAALQFLTSGWNNFSGHPVYTWKPIWFFSIFQKYKGQAIRDQN